MKRFRALRIERYTNVQYYYYYYYYYYYLSYGMCMNERKGLTKLYGIVTQYVLKKLVQSTRKIYSSSVTAIEISVFMDFKSVFPRNLRLSCRDIAIYLSTLEYGTKRMITDWFTCLYYDMMMNCYDLLIAVTACCDTSVFVYTALEALFYTSIGITHPGHA